MSLTDSHLLLLIVTQWKRELATIYSVEMVSGLLVRSLDTDMAKLLKRASRAGRVAPFLATVTVLMYVC